MIKMLKKKGESAFGSLIMHKPQEENSIEIPLYPIQYHIWNKLQTKLSEEEKTDFID